MIATLLIVIIVSVSYTHLDVYKRQVHLFSLQKASNVMPVFSQYSIDILDGAETAAKKGIFALKHLLTIS